MRGKVLLTVFFASTCAVADAEERFYQVMDASGRMQVIREPGSEHASEKGKTEKASQPKPIEQHSMPLRRDPQMPPSESAGGALAPYAAYDGDDYVDSEVMDNSHRSQGERQRFFIMSDGAGQRIENMSGGYQQPLEPNQSPEPPDEFFSLRSSYTQLPLGLALDMTNGCLSGRQIEGARPLALSRLSDVVFDKQLMNFILPGQPVQVYRVSNEGARTVSFRSYSRTDIEPAFVVPFVAFADGNGCINRIVDGYFQRFYPETKSRHPLLEGELVMHADDVYVMLIMPVSDVGKRNYKPEYRISSLGRISIKWQQ